MMTADDLGAMTSNNDTRPLMPIPSPDPASTQAAIYGFARCFGAKAGREVYLSAPITTGKTFVAWKHSLDETIDESHDLYYVLRKQHVVSPNIARVKPLVDALRRQFPDHLVVDPTAFADVPGWDQNDYHAFWCGLIERYIGKTIFADGWQYSTGCVYEFSTAISCGVEILTEDLRPLSTRAGLLLIEEAIEAFSELGVNSDLLSRAYTSVLNARKTRGDL